MAPSARDTLISRSARYPHRAAKAGRYTGAAGEGRICCLPLAEYCVAMQTVGSWILAFIWLNTEPARSRTSFHAA